MDYEPQTISKLEATERLEQFDRQFESFARTHDMETLSAENIVKAIDERLVALIEHLDQETSDQFNQFREA